MFSLNREGSKLTSEWPKNRHCDRTGNATKTKPVNKGKRRFLIFIFYCFFIGNGWLAIRHVLVTTPESPFLHVNLFPITFALSRFILYLCISKGSA